MNIFAAVDRSDNIICHLICKNALKINRSSNLLMSNTYI